MNKDRRKLLQSASLYNMPFSNLLEAGCSIERFIEELLSLKKELEDKGYEEIGIQFTVDDDWGYEYDEEVCITYYRIETDEEYNKRIKKEQQQEERIRKYKESQILRKKKLEEQIVK